MPGVFQSPQWGDCSKGQPIGCDGLDVKFQSPQWGDCSKERTKRCL